MIKLFLEAHCLKMSDEFEIQSNVFSNQSIYNRYACNTSCCVMLKSIINQKQLNLIYLIKICLFLFH